MATVSFLLRTTKKIAPLTVRLLFRHNKTDFVIASKTPILSTQDQWHIIKSAKKIKDAATLKEIKHIKSNMYDLEVLILEQFNKTNSTEIDKLWLNKLIDDLYHPKRGNIYPSNLLKYFKSYLEIKSKEVSEQTIKKNVTIFNMLKNYCKSNDRLQIQVKDVDTEFQKDFELFCSSTSYSNNTTSKALSVIRTVCKHAFSNGIEISNKLDSIKIKKEVTSTIYLNLDELESIKSLQTNVIGSRLDKARDWLLISCYTGQRISDFKYFSKKIIVEIEGVKYIQFKQQKTSTPIIVPLHKEVIKILDKRNGEFPSKISDQKYNDYIKEVCKLAKINKVVKSKKLTNIKGLNRKIEGVYQKWEVVSSHIGRRSFATNFYLKIPTPLLMNATGHKKESTFLNYIGKASQDLAIELSKYF